MMIIIMYCMMYKVLHADPMYTFIVHVSDLYGLWTMDPYVMDHVRAGDSWHPVARYRRT